MKPTEDKELRLQLGEHLEELENGCPPLADCTEYPNCDECITTATLKLIERLGYHKED